MKLVTCFFIYPRVYLLLLPSSFALSNNVCSSFLDYFFLGTSPNCWYNFAAADKAAGIIVKSGYPCREYKVETEDNYVLTVFNIPAKNGKKGVVFLQHGIESSGTVFISIGNESLAFLLADAGYDVWIGNFRGNEYSEKHKFMDISMREFWDYSVDDIALQDVPAMLNFVKSHTPSKEKIIYIGHSLGSTLTLMLCSERPEYCKEIIKHLFYLGPAYKLIYMKSPYRHVFQYLKIINNVSTFLNLVQVLSLGFKSVFRPVCFSTPLTMQFCYSLLNVFFGINTEIKMQTVPVMIHQLPAGTSAKTLEYLRDSINDHFRKYDYGATKNMAVYGSKVPPDYNITKMNVNISMFYSTGDWATSDKDAHVLYNTLPDNIRFGNHEIKNSKINHFDLVMGPSAKKLIFDKIFEELDSLD